MSNRIIQLFIVLSALATNGHGHGNEDNHYQEVVRQPVQNSAITGSNEINDKMSTGMEFVSVFTMENLTSTV